VQFVTIVESEFNILISAMMKNPDYILKQHILSFLISLNINILVQFNGTYMSFQGTLNVVFP